MSPQFTALGIASVKAHLPGEALGMWVEDHVAGAIGTTGTLFMMHVCC